MSIADLLGKEYRRYKRRSPFWTVVCLVELGLVLWLAPEFGHWVWPQLLAYMEAHHIPEWQCSIVLSYCWNVSIFALSNLFFLAVYKAEHPFFE